MWSSIYDDAFADHLLLAGQRALPGLYKELGTGRIVQLESEEPLPATLNGRVACYVRMSARWGDGTRHTETHN
jgi:hypothetical protein